MSMDSLSREAFKEPVDVVVSCLASRTGAHRVAGQLAGPGGWVAGQLAGPAGWEAGCHAAGCPLGLV